MASICSPLHLLYVSFSPSFHHNNKLFFHHCLWKTRNTTTFAYLLLVFLLSNSHSELIHITSKHIYPPFLHCCVYWEPLTDLSVCVCVCVCCCCWWCLGLHSAPLSWVSLCGGDFSSLSLPPTLLRSRKRLALSWLFLFERGLPRAFLIVV